MPITSPSFAVVIPMFNEEQGAARCIDAVCSVLSQQAERCQLIVVEDGSKDKTKEILKALESSHTNLTVVLHERNQGYGRALVTGAQRAAQDGFDYALFMDSDLTNDPTDIPKFVEQMKRNIDVIKATRYSDGGKIQGVPFFRVAISRVGNLVAGALFRLPLFDCTNGFRAVKVGLLNTITLQENNFSIIMEELYRLKPLAQSYARIPVTLTDRAADLRGTSFRYKPSIFWDYLKYPLWSFLGI